jgi:hypothetical protein
MRDRRDPLVAYAQSGRADRRGSLLSGQATRFQSEQLAAAVRVTLDPMPDAPRIFSAATTGRRGRAPSQIELIEANVSPEEIAKRRAEQRKRELIGAGRKGFDITMPSDFDWDSFSPSVVRVRDQTVWKREPCLPPDGYVPSTHCVVVTDGGAWYYLTAAATTGPKAPRSVAELQERQEERARKATEQERERAKVFKASRARARGRSPVLIRQVMEWRVVARRKRRSRRVGMQSGPGRERPQRRRLRGRRGAPGCGGCRYSQ